MIKAGLSNRYKVDPYGTEEILSDASVSLAPKLTIDYGDEVQEAEFINRPTKGSLDTNISPIAVINSIKGNTIVWNQLMDNGNFASAANWNKNTCSFSVSNNVGTFLSAQKGGNVYHSMSRVLGYKYALFADVKLNTPTTKVGLCMGGVMVSGGNSRETTEWQKLSAVFNSPGTGTGYAGIIDNRDSGWDDVLVKNYCIFNLTAIYGVGNEPSITDFQADYYKWFGKQLTYEDYDAGSLRNCKMSGIKTTGLNQWDEEWELGIYNTNTGEKAPNSSCFRSKNRIPVIPNTVYYRKFSKTNYASNSEVCLIGYDKDGNKIWHRYYGGSNTFTTVEECAYITLYVSNATLYRNDICINLSNQDKNDQYESYKSNFCNIPVASLKGKLNGQGSSVVVFEDGIKSAGDVRDEIKVENSLLKGIKKVDTRVYESGDVNSSTMTTDGANYTNYALATPEEYIIDDVSVEKVMLGSTEVTKVYLGDQLIFEESN